MALVGPPQPLCALLITLGAKKLECASLAQWVCFRKGGEWQQCSGRPLNNRRQTIGGAQLYSTLLPCHPHNNQILWPNLRGCWQWHLTMGLVWNNQEIFFVLTMMCHFLTGLKGRRKRRCMLMWRKQTNNLGGFSYVWAGWLAEAWICSRTQWEAPRSVYTGRPTHNRYGMEIWDSFLLQICVLLLKVSDLQVLL